MPLIFDTPDELSRGVAQRVRAARLERQWTQAELAERAGISEMTYRHFERTGQISLERLAGIAIALGRAAELTALFQPSEFRSLEDVERSTQQRHRGSRRSTGRRSSP